MKERVAKPEQQDGAAGAEAHFHCQNVVVGDQVGLVCDVFVLCFQAELLHLKQRFPN